MVILSNFVSGTDMFQLRHILAIVICAALIVVLPILAAKKNLKISTVHRILLAVGIVSETIKVIAYILMNEETLGGYLPKTDLPFHLCSIQIIFILILNFSKNEKVKHLLQGFMIPTCLIGGIAAIILATSSARSNWVIAVQYYGYHSVITAYAIYLLANKEIKFTVKDYANTLIMLAITLFVAIYINSILYTPKFVLNPETGLFEAKEFMSINFMYVSDPPQSGLPFLNEDHGWIVYIVHYALLAAFAVTMCYIKPIIDAIRAKCSKQK